MFLHLCKAGRQGAGLLLPARMKEASDRTGQPQQHNNITHLPLLLSITHLYKNTTAKYVYFLS